MTYSTCNTWDTLTAFETCIPIISGLLNKVVVNESAVGSIHISQLFIIIYRSQQKPVNNTIPVRRPAEDDPFILIGPVFAGCGIVVLLLSVEVCVRRQKVIKLTEDLSSGQ